VITLPDTKTVNLFVEKYHHETLIDWPFAERPVFEFRQVIEHLAVALHALQEVLVQRKCMAEYPSNWKEALKERFAPAWFLRRWPVRKTRIDMEVLYPEIAIPERKHTVRIAVRRPDDWLPPYSD
jgi:hypothetical protein